MRIQITREQIEYSKNQSGAFRQFVHDYYAQIVKDIHERETLMMQNILVEDDRLRVVDPYLRLQEGL